MMHHHNHSACGIIKLEKQFNYYTWSPHPCSRQLFISKAAVLLPGFQSIIDLEKPFIKEETDLKIFHYFLMISCIIEQNWY